jgi:hypothetical protein
MRARGHARSLAEGTVNPRRAIGAVCGGSEHVLQAEVYDLHCVPRWLGRVAVAYRFLCLAKGGLQGSELAILTTKSEQPPLLIARMGGVPVASHVRLFVSISSSESALASVITLRPSVPDRAIGA